jgi:hypothetical protein
VAGALVSPRQQVRCSDANAGLVVRVEATLPGGQAQRDEHHKGTPHIDPAEHDTVTHQQLTADHEGDQAEHAQGGRRRSRQALREPDVAGRGPVEADHHVHDQCGARTDHGWGRAQQATGEPPRDQRHHQHQLERRGRHNAKNALAARYPMLGVGVVGIAVESGGVKQKPRHE